MNIRKIVAIALAVIAFLLVVYGCRSANPPFAAVNATQASSGTTTVAMPTSVSETTAPEVSAPQTSATSGTASQTVMPNLKNDGVTIQVIKAIVNSVGHNRNDLMAVMGVPDETPIASPEGRAVWIWRIKESPGNLWYIYASTTNSTKAVDHIFITFGRVMSAIGVADIFAGNGELKTFWGGGSYSDKKSFVLLGRNLDKEEIRMYSYSNEPLVVVEPSIDDNGKRVERFTRNRALNLSGTYMQKIAVGTNPIMNGNSDTYLYKIGSWAELK